MMVVAVHTLVSIIAAVFAAKFLIGIPAVLLMRGAGWASAFETVWVSTLCAAASAGCWYIAYVMFPFTLTASLP